jgi:hypothetical protein
MKRRNLVLIITALGVYSMAARPACALFDIHLILDGNFTTSQTAAAHQAELLWENAITGYQPGITLTGVTMRLETFSEEVGGTLGRAYAPGRTWQEHFWLSTGGKFQLDTFDMPSLESSGRLDDVIAHEIGHLLGFGTLWMDNGLYIYDSGEYTGAFGVAAYNDEFVQDNWIIPVELGGGPGTANAHWDENDGGTGLTGIHDLMSRDFRDELMTGWLNSNPFLSRTTVQSMRDLGYTVVPEPIGLTIFLGGITIMAVGKRPFWSCRATVHA